jgi:hypothetical protein
VTAIVYSGTRRYYRQKSRRVTRSGWKGAVVWYCVLAIGGFFGLNWIYQVIRKPGEIFAPISASLICLMRFIVRRSKEVSKTVSWR